MPISIIFKISGDGSVDFPEFVQYICSHSQPLDEEEELREAFKLFDKSGNGFIKASGNGYVTFENNIKLFAFCSI